MEISEEMKSEHNIVCIHYVAAGKTCEKWVDIHKNASGEVMTVSVGSTEISAFDLEILAFLKKEGKL